MTNLKFQPYARVSTDDKDQDTERQLHRFHDWIPPNAETLPPITEERSASVEDPFTRPGWRKACEAARDNDAILLVEDADRITRLGCFILGWAITETFRRYAGLRIWFSLFDPTPEAQEAGFSRLMLAFKAEAALEENRKLKVRTSEGMTLAKSKGAIIGRPRKELTPEELELALTMHKDGKGLRTIAHALSEGRGAFRVSISGAERRRRTVSPALLHQVLFTKGNRSENPKP